MTYTDRRVEAVAQELSRVRLQCYAAERNRVDMQLQLQHARDIQAKAKGGSRPHVSVWTVVLHSRASASKSPDARPAPPPLHPIHTAATLNTLLLPVIKKVYAVQVGQRCCAENAWKDSLGCKSRPTAPFA